MKNFGRNSVFRIILMLWIIYSLPSLVMAHTTRLATSTKMVKSQVSMGLSINPLTSDARASFDYSMLDSTRKL